MSLYALPLNTLKMRYIKPKAMQNKFDRLVQIVSNKFVK